MNPHTWIRLVAPASFVTCAALVVTTPHARAQAAPATPVDAATLQKYDTNRNGVLDPDERAAMEADRATPTETAGAGATSAAGGEVVQLSPFQVDATKDKGYFAENTLAGSRMNTNISDLGASISVVTKQQIEDTASVDINDVFRYEINTEGSSTYTPATATFRNDGVLDVNAGGTQGNAVGAFTNATANRVRGIGVPSTAINYYPSISQIPMDAYNVQSLEISRGPNSMLFGMGSPAGIVNQSTAQAALNKNTNTAQVRFDQNGSYRGTFSLNRSLIKNRLAIYAAILFDDRQFERKPSYDITRRQYGAVTFKPFEKTTIRANVEGYNNDNRRPNTLTPRDFVTQWRLAGMPVYDPVSKTITKQSTGQVIGPYILSASSPYANQVINYIRSRPDFDPSKFNATANTYNGVSIFGQAALSNTSSILYVPGINWATASRSFMQIQNGQLVNWFQPLANVQYRTAWGTATDPSANAPLFPATTDVYANPVWADYFNRDITRSEGWTNNGTNIGNYKYPGVTSRSVYDWKKININQANFGKERNQNYNVEFEQEITKDLFLNGGWFRQDFDSFSNYTLGQLNVPTLFVDTNKTLPDGSANPYFGKPYVTDFDPDRYINAETDDHFRAMLAYTPDFRRHGGWMKWLGHHQILGLWSRDESMLTSYRQRLEYIDSTSAAGKYRYMANQNNNAQGQPTGWNFQTTSLQRAFYLANPNDPSDGRVTRSSGEWNPLTYQGDIKVYDYASNSFQNVNMTTTFNNFDASTGRNQRTVQSLSGGMTNYLWDDRLVTTFGIRRDVYKARATTTGAITNDAGTVISPTMLAPAKWSNGVLQTQNFFNRWTRWDRLTGNTKTAGAVFRPFKGWSVVESGANSGNPWWEFVRDFAVSVNKSDNFNAPPSAQVDAFGRQLPKPTGEGKDWGFQFSMFQNKLFARVTWFEATNQDERTSPGASINRLTDNIDTTLFRGWARTIALINMGFDPRSSSFGQNLTPAEEQSVQDAAAKIWGLPYTYYGDLPGSIGATRDAKAKGVEAQINYNPTRNWTMKFTFGKQQTVYSNVLQQFQAWYNYRSPTWMSAKATDYLLPQYRNLTTYSTSGGTPVDITNFWTAYGFNSAVTQADQFGNTNVQNYYNNVVFPQYQLASDLNNQAAPGQRKYRWSYLTNYNFDHGLLKGWSVGGSERWEDKSIIGYYGRASHANTSNPNLLDLSDTKRPIYDKANSYTDLWVNYQRKIMRDRVRMKLQLNVVDVFENGGLRTVGVNYDGSPYAFRIIDPRQFIFTATFEF